MPASARSVSGQSAGAHATTSGGAAARPCRRQPIGAPNRPRTAISRRQYIHIRIANHHRSSAEWAHPPHSAPRPPPSAPAGPSAPASWSQSCCPHSSGKEAIQPKMRADVPRRPHRLVGQHRHRQFGYSRQLFQRLNHPVIYIGVVQLVLPAAAEKNPPPRSHGLGCGYRVLASPCLCTNTPAIPSPIKPAMTYVCNSL